MTDLLPCPFGYAYRYHDPGSGKPVLIYGKTSWNGQKPREVIPLYTAAALKAAQPDMLVDALEERIVSADLGHVITPRLLGFESHASEGYSEAIAKIVSRINDKARAALKAVKP